jgi:hypothetical protein
MPICQGGAQAGCAEAFWDIPKDMVTTTARTNKVCFFILFIDELLDGSKFQNWGLVESDAGNDDRFSHR